MSIERRLLDLERRAAQAKSAENDPAAQAMAEDPELQRLSGELNALLATGTSPAIVAYRSRFQTPPATKAEWSNFFDILAHDSDAQAILNKIALRQRDVRAETGGKVSYEQYRDSCPNPVSRELWEHI